MKQKFLSAVMIVGIILGAFIFLLPAKNIATTKVTTKQLEKNKSKEKVRNVAIIAAAPDLFLERGREGIKIDISNMKNLFRSYGFEIVVFENASKQQLISKMQSLAKELGEKDIFTFYFTGHGANIDDINGDEQDNLDEILILRGFDKNHPSLDSILVDDELNYYLSQIKAKKVIILDSCHSGTGYKSLSKDEIKTIGKIDIKRKVLEKSKLLKNNNSSEKDLSSEKNFLFFGAARDDESSRVTASGSLFTLAINEGLKHKKADSNRDEKITPRELVEYSRRYIKNQGRNYSPTLHGDRRLFNKDIISFLKNEESVEYTSPRTHRTSQNLRPHQAQRSHHRTPSEDNAISRKTFEEKLDGFMKSQKHKISVKIDPRKRVYYPKDKIYFIIDPKDYNGYLSILYVNENEVTVLFPNKFHPEELDIHKKIILPRPENRFDFVPMPPFGRTTVYVILSKKPLGLFDSQNQKDIKFKVLSFSDASKDIGAVKNKDEDMVIGKIQFQTQGE